jgi:hypothetical protein
MSSKRKLTAAIAAAAWCACVVVPGWSATQEPAGKASGTVAATTARTTTDATSARSAFDQLKALAGVWEGTAGADKQPTSVVYRVASGGTVVLETQFPETDHEMITAYHMDGDALVATHYCSQGNQPRFRFDPAASTPARLVFAFAGGTNLDPNRDGHVHGGEIVLAGRDALQARWEFWSQGKMEAALPFELQRKR